MPFELEAFQAEMVADYFAGVRESLILVPKKNGKTTLLAALALHHLFTVDDAACYIGAASRDQATILWDQARGFVRRSPGLEDHVKISRGYRELRAIRDDGKIKVLAADADTADGLIPTLALIDEYHRHKTEGLAGILRDGLGAPGAERRMITISTAGTAADSPLGRLRALAHELPTFVRDKERCKNTARSADGGFVLHEWCCDPDDDLDDLELVARANPASWQTPAKLAERHSSPSTTPWQWARFAGGVWTEGEDPWIVPAKWDALKVPHGVPFGEPEGETWLGVDLGVRHDSTAIVALWRHGDRWGVRADVLAPGTTGVKLETVEERIRGLCRDYQVQAVVFDPWSLRRSAELLEAEGIPMVEFPMSPERMSLASANLYELIESGRLAHDGNATLRAHVLGGVTKETERGWRLVKDPRSKRPIDALIALAIAARVATAQPEKVPSRQAIFI